MKQFLTYGHVLTSEEIEAHAEEGVPENPPTLDMFKEQVRLKLRLKKSTFVSVIAIAYVLYVYLLDILKCLPCDKVVF